MPADDRAIAISATFTAEALQPALAFWVAELGLEYEIRFAGYGQVFQQLLDPAELFARNRGGINVVLLRLEDWASAGIEMESRRFAESVRQSSQVGPLIVAICPASPAAHADGAPPGRGLAGTLDGIPGVYTITPEDLSRRYPVVEVHDPHADELGHLPYTPVFFAALATAIARKIHAITTAPFKLIAVDCDDTLWSGICGEDGPSGVVVDAPHRALQQFLLERRSEGMLLALCSKNNERDVAETFEAHPEMPLRLAHFAASRINWGSKGANLASLAQELELAPDSIILLDDNPKECTETQAGFPHVLALPLPSRAGDIPAFLDHVWAFDRVRVTDEDRRRPELYTQRAERVRAESAAASLEEFLAGLQLEMKIAPAAPSQFARIAQLTQRTNQMNATLVRRNEAEMHALRAECLAVEVSDRFGSYGLAGAIIFRFAGDTLSVDTFVLSCRALGRGVEHRMLAHLGEIATARRIARVEIPFIEGPRNRPAALFLESLRAAKPGGIFRFPATEAAAVRYEPGRAAPPASEISAPVPAGRKRIDYLRIATELRSPSVVLYLTRATNGNIPHRRAVADPPRTPLERELAELWAGLLNLSAVGVHENFFELGGHSLLAVQLLSRVRQIHGVDLSLEVVYSGEFTVAELAKAVELKEIEQAGGDYRDLLAELEGLSDEEVRALLAEEQDAS
jgi:FkbH-like protein